MRKRQWVGKDGVTYRSQLEAKIADNLLERGVAYEYEAYTYTYTLRAYKHLCDSCGTNDISKVGSYLTDFYLPSTGIYVEAKGRFTGGDRRKMEAMVKQHPELDIRMLFPSDNWISKKHAKRYSGWCESKGIKYAIGTRIPEEWCE